MLDSHETEKIWEIGNESGAVKECTNQKMIASHIFSYSLFLLKNKKPLLYYFYVKTEYFWKLSFPYINMFIINGFFYLWTRSCVCVHNFLNFLFNELRLLNKEWVNFHESW